MSEINFQEFMGLDEIEEALDKTPDLYAIIGSDNNDFILFKTDGEMKIAAFIGGDLTNDYMIEFFNSNEFDEVWIDKLSVMIKGDPDWEEIGDLEIKATVFKEGDKLKFESIA